MRLPDSTLWNVFITPSIFCAAARVLSINDCRISPLSFPFSLMPVKRPFAIDEI